MAEEQAQPQEKMAQDWASATEGEPAADAVEGGDGAPKRVLNQDEIDSLLGFGEADGMGRDTFIRSTQRGILARANAGNRSTQLVTPIRDVLAAFKNGSLKSYDQLIGMGR